MAVEEVPVLELYAYIRLVAELAEVLTVSADMGPLLIDPTVATPDTLNAPAVTVPVEVIFPQPEIDVQSVILPELFISKPPSPAENVEQVISPVEVIFPQPEIPPQSVMYPVELTSNPPLPTDNEPVVVILCLA
jgi:hypothetical protein